MKTSHTKGGTMTAKKDAAYDVRVNPVTLPDGSVVAWAEAFTRLSDEGMRAARPKEAQA